MAFILNDSSRLAATIGSNSALISIVRRRQFEIPADPWAYPWRVLAAGKSAEAEKSCLLETTVHVRSAVVD